MNEITSIKNPIVAKVLEAKNSPKNQVFLENIKLVLEAQKSGYKLSFLLVEKEMFDEFLRTNNFFEREKCFAVSRPLLKKICDTRTPQGVVGVFEFDFDKNFECDANFVVLDSVQDPGNLGTILRSASATSFSNVVLVNSANPFNQKVVRSSAGALFRVNITKFATHSEFLDFARKNNLSFFVADMHGENIFCKSKLPSPIGVVFGNEGNGVSQILRQNSIGALAIPMKNGLESLNVAVSMSIITFCIDNLKN